MDITVEVQGLKGVEDALAQAGPKLAKRALRKALKAGGDLMVAGAKSRAPLLKVATKRRQPGELRDSIGMKIAISAKQESGTVTEALRGREVILIPDNDAPGRKRVMNIARALLGKVARLVVLELEGGAKDVTEWFDRGHSELELIALLDGDEVSR